MRNESRRSYNSQVENASSFSLPTLTGDSVLRRFGVALGCSLLLHFALLVGVRVSLSSGPEEVRQVMISARLMNVALPSPSPAALPPTIVAAAKKVPAVVPPETAPAPPEPAPAPPSSAVPAAAPPSSTPAPPSSLPAVELPVAEDPTYYPAAKVDVHPQSLKKIEPTYPDAAADAGIQGQVTLLLLIDEYGVVRDASVADAKPEGWFEDSALAAFKNARFTPAERKGRAVKSRVLIRVTYELNGNGSAVKRSPAVPVR